MQAITRQIPALGPQFRIVLAQLRSPFAPPTPELTLLDNETLGPPEFVWKDNASIKHRLSKVRRVLEFAKTIKPQLVAFPEYAVPDDPDAKLLFQEFATANSCVLIPGSYYERKPGSPLHRNNVSRVYLPGQDPITIVKHDRVPGEIKALTDPPATPNIAHLFWRDQSGLAVGISIFLCRDYLVPYDAERKSLLDWDRPGLNLVIMCSGQTSLFEAQAGLDVRRLRGQGRFVALCNCAATNENTNAFTGTALLGPTKEARRRYGDLIERLPSQDEGILTADLDLTAVKLVQIKPDKIDHDPLGRVRSYRIIKDANEHILIDPIKQLAPSERGVWHPALLDVLGRNIAILLRKSRRYHQVAEALCNPISKKLRFVSAAGIIGEQDFLFRFYEVVGEKLSLSGTPYSFLPQNEQDRLFSEDPHKYIVEPRRIYKYRTVRVDRNEADWNDKKKELALLLPRPANPKRRKQFLSALCRLARDWNDRRVPEELREKARKFFLEKLETVPHFGLNSGNNLRQRYILVSLPNDTGTHETSTFERHIIDSWLVDLPSVRSIYGLATKHGSTHFQFWIDVIADPYEADTLVLELKRRGEQEGLHIGTRSMDVMEHLVYESVEGIENTDFGEELCRFMQEVNGIELETTIMLDNADFMFDWSRAWDSQIAMIDSAVSPKVCENITAFYVHFFTGNFALRDAQRQESLRDAANAWLMTYQDLETNCKSLLLKFTGTTTTTEVEQRMEAHFRNAKPLWSEIRHDWIRLLLEFMKSSDPERNFFDIEDMKQVRRDVEGLRRFRNDMGHEGAPRKIEALYILGTLLDQRQNAAARVTDVTRTLVHLFNAVQATLHTLAATTG